MGEFKARTLRNAATTVGFAFFLATEYCTLFGCSLVTAASVHNGLEYLWMYSGIASCVTGIAALLVLRKRAVSRTALGATAAAFSALGSLGIWAAYSTGTPETFLGVSPVGGALQGVSLALFMILWGDILAERDAEDLEFIVPAAFLLAFAFYCTLLLTKVVSMPILIVMAALAVGSAVLAQKSAGSRNAERPGHSSKPSADNAARSLEAKGASNRAVSGDSALTANSARVFRMVMVVALLAAVLWMQVAFFRVIETPDGFGNRFTHFLIPFSISCVAALALFAACLLLSRRLDISLAFRFQLPLLLASCGVLYLNPAEQNMRLAAYALNFLGMFSMQFGYWIGLGKQAHRDKRNARLLFAALATGKGAGITVGCVLAFGMLQSVQLTQSASFSILLSAAVVLAAMLLGYSPNLTMYEKVASRRAGSTSPDRPNAPARAGALLAQSAASSQPDRRGENHPVEKHAPHTAHQRVENAETTESALSSAEELDDLFARQAEALAARYGLTERETEVAALMIAGRSRPFIRDELVISLNTVHTHCKRILSKCGVHSQQDLIGLARERH